MVYNKSLNAIIRLLMQKSRDERKIPETYRTGRLGAR